MTTLDSLQALTDEQLIEKVAVEVMGLQIKGTGKRWDQKTPGLFVINHATPNSARLFSPLTDWNHTMEVVRKMTEKGCTASIEVSEGETTVEFHGAWEHNDRALVDKNPRRAICLAALLAVSPQTDAPRIA